MENDLTKDRSDRQEPESEELETSETFARNQNEECVKKDAADIANVILENNGFGNPDCQKQIQQILENAMERKNTSSRFDPDETGMKRAEVQSMVTEINRILKENGSTLSLDSKYCEQDLSKLACPPGATKDLREHRYEAIPKTTLTLNDASNGTQTELTAKASPQERVWYGSGSCIVVPYGSIPKLPYLRID